MSDLLTGTPSTESAAQAAPAKPAPSGVAVESSTSTDSMPAYFAGLTKAQKEKIAKSGVKLPGQITDFGDLFLELTQKASTNGARPAKDAPKDQWDSWRKANGIPETPDGYVFDKPQLPEGEVYSDEVEKWWKAKAHEFGLSVDDAKRVYAEFIGNQISEQNKALAQTAQQRAEQEATKKTFVAANKEALESKYGPKYPDVVKKANEVFLAMPAAEQKMVQQAGLANSAWFISLLYDYGRVALPDSLLAGAASAPPSKGTNGKREIDYGPKFRAYHHIQ